ncbi:tryptophan-associated transmembrane protein [Motilibacter peucedani]|uniref:Tryptophan-associated transmembrane protein n=1 Tax=Motilibacter peucedani TaxID=598650 RepID=A0A420XVN0_9ACTN|nr:Trp biosynthesis-associated membrane protein [Motilibacter peucedani]RKS84253.1 tryptophan-associated transmembrane protein [Motilibacter peucedani]
MAAGSPRSSAVAATLAGGALLLLAAGRTWSTVRVRGGVPLPPVHLTGRTLAAGVPALGLVALAGAGGLLAARGAARRLVGALLVAAGAGAAALTLARGVLPGAREHAWEEARRSLAGSSGWTATATGWPVLALVGALLVVGGGAVALAARRWSALGARYDAPTARPAGARSAWEALDRGEDPTSGV